MHKCSSANGRLRLARSLSGSVNHRKVTESTMSASPIARQAHSHAQLIPSMRKILISEPSQMPDVYSSTPNGTLYSTTPGGNYRSFVHKVTETREKWTFCGSALEIRAAPKFCSRETSFRAALLWPGTIRSRKIVKPAYFHVEARVSDLARANQTCRCLSSMPSWW